MKAGLYDKIRVAEQELKQAAEAGERNLMASWGHKLDPFVEFFDHLEEF